MKRNRVSILLFVTLAASSAAASLATDYPGPWQRDAAPALTRTLAQNGVKGCGEFAWRRHVAQSGEYLVYCSRDGSAWSAWLAWTASGKVMGPYAPDPVLPRP